MNSSANKISKRTIQIAKAIPENIQPTEITAHPLIIIKYSLQDKLGDSVEHKKLWDLFMFNNPLTYLIKNL